MNEPRFRFGPLEREGWLLGMRLGQLVVLILGVLVAVALLRVPNSALAAALALGTLLAAAMCAFVPVGGRTLEEWSLTAVRFVWSRLLSDHRFRSIAPLLGQTRSGELPLGPLPRTLSGLSILSATHGDNESVGIIKDSRAGTFALVLSTQASNFALLDEVDKHRRLNALGQFLNSAGRDNGVFDRLQFIDRTVRSDLRAAARHLDANRQIPADAPPVSSYRQLLDDAQGMQTHETYLVGVLAAKRSMRAIESEGGRDEGACAALLKAMEAVRPQLATCGVTASAFLSPRALAQLIRTTFNPFDRAVAADVVEPEKGVHPRNAWPLVADTSWHLYRTDGGAHVTYWVEEMPRQDVGADWLLPLILDSKLDRSLSVTLAPVPSYRARRDVESARVGYMTDENLRARKGFLPSARRQVEAANVEEREAELVAGHVDYRFSMYCTVSAPTSDEVEAACAEFESEVHLAQLRVRRMNGEHDLGFTFTMALGRGVR